MVCSCTYSMCKSSVGQLSNLLGRNGMFFFQPTSDVALVPANEASKLYLLSAGRQPLDQRLWCISGPNCFSDDLNGSFNSLLMHRPCPALCCRLCWMQLKTVNQSREYIHTNTLLNIHNLKHDKLNQKHGINFLNNSG